MRYYKGEPSQFVIKYRSGRIKRKGTGIGFWYRRKRNNIVTIPAMTIDSNYIFNEVTKNHQSITLQGHFTYKIKDPLVMAKILDFTVDPLTDYYLTEDPEKLELRIRNVVHMMVKGKILKMALIDAIFAAEDLANYIMQSINEAKLLEEMGIEILSIAFTSIKATPEISNALEADYRESLQRKADEAIYARRAAAVEQESKIKENQLQTQITLEEQKKNLIALEGENITKEAEFKAQAESMALEVYQKMKPDKLLAHALKELAENSEKIGNLTITSEILAALLKDKKD